MDFFKPRVQLVAPLNVQPRGTHNCTQSRLQSQTNRLYLPEVVSQMSCTLRWKCCCPYYQPIEDCSTLYQCYTNSHVFCNFNATLLQRGKVLEMMLFHLGPSYLQTWKISYTFWSQFQSHVTTSNETVPQSKVQFMTSEGFHCYPRTLTDEHCLHIRFTNGLRLVFPLNFSVSKTCLNGWNRVFFF